MNLWKVKTFMFAVGFLYLSKVYINHFDLFNIWLYAEEHTVILDNLTKKVADGNSKN